MTNDPFRPFEKAVAALAREVFLFHERWNATPCAEGQEPEMAQNRMALLEEEVAELREAYESGDPEETCLEAADVLFVAIGTMYSLGATGRQAMEKVKSKNSRKTNATHYTHPGTGKIVRR